MKRASELVFGSPCLGVEEENEVLDALRHAWIGTGPKVRQFEEQFSRYKGGLPVAAVSSCSAGLHLACLALGLGPGDEVITTAMTFCATVNAIIHAGATPVLADINPRTLNIDPVAIEKKLTSRTRAILVVHFAGRPCAMDRIIDLARRHDLRVIEDCAHAIESEIDGQKCGTFGDLGCFSFYATKNITTAEGGMVVGRDPRLVEQVKTLAMNGLSADAWQRFADEGYRHYAVVAAGFKYNMTDLAAAIGLAQLTKIDRFWCRREELWQFYQDAFQTLPVGLPAPAATGSRHAYHLYTLRIDSQRTGIDRDHFLREMARRNIGVGVHYRALPEHPYYRQTFGWAPEDYPHARRYGAETVSLPLSAGMSDADAGDVVDAVKDILSR